MRKEKYLRDIQNYLLQMENWNNKVGLRGVAWRDMIKANLLENVIERMSIEKFDDDDSWIERLRQAARRYEDHEEDKKLRHSNGESSKPKREERGCGSNLRPPKRYTIQKRKDYRASFVGQSPAKQKLELKKKFTKGKTAIT